MRLSEESQRPVFFINVFDMMKKHRTTKNDGHILLLVTYVDFTRELHFEVTEGQGLDNATGLEDAGPGRCWGLEDAGAWKMLGPWKMAGA